MSILESQAASYYQTYYGRAGSDRNNLRTNSGVLFQTLAQEAAIVRAIGSLELEPRDAQLLDVGCGDGANLFQLLRLNFHPLNIVGIDLQKERLRRARDLYPQVRWIHGDATQMELGSGTFDVVFESTMFATLTDDSQSGRIAQEMQRVCKVGGYLVLVDWWTPKPGDSNFKALTKRRLRQLFPRKAFALERTFRGALVPPVGRWFSRYLPAFYFAVAACLPWTVGQGVYVLRKLASNPLRWR